MMFNVNREKSFFEGICLGQCNKFINRSLCNDVAVDQHCYLITEFFGDGKDVRRQYDRMSLIS